MATKTLEQAVLTREHGKNIGVVMGDLLFKDLVTCVEELVANAHDADAENVYITYDPQDHRLTISDDGTGMDMDGLKAFYRMGDSVKRAKRHEAPLTTEKGRRFIGKHGIATLVLRSLAKHYTLDTWKDGKHFSASETLTEDDRDDDEIKFNVERCPKTKHGTRLMIDDLRFLHEGRELEVGELRRRLMVEMPVLPDFSISLNKERLKPRSIVNGVEYKIDFEDKQLGHVYGSIWKASRTLKSGESGLYVKVNGRAVGGHNLENKDFGVVSSLASRVFGIIHADGLDDIVGFDRDNFLRDHPKYKKLASKVKHTTKQIRQDIEMEGKKKTAENFEKHFGAYAPKISQFLSEQYDRTFRVKVSADPFVGSSDVSMIDVENGEFFINPESEYAKTQKYDPKKLNEFFLHALRFAMVNQIMPDERKAEHAALEQKMAEAIMPRAGPSKYSIASVLGGSDEIKETYRISRNRLYDFHEVSQATGFANALIKRMVDSGLMEEKEDEKLLGAEVIGIQNELKGKITLFDAIRRALAGKELKNEHYVYQFKERSANAKLRELEDADALPEFVTDISDNENPFWVVNERYFPLFKGFIETNKFAEVVFAQRLFGYSKGKSKEGHAITYVLEVESESKEFKMISRNVAQELEFIASGGVLPPGVKHKSFLGEYKGRRWVVGMYTGRVSKMQSDFKEQGYDNFPLNRDLIKDPLQKAIEQKNRAVPMRGTLKIGNHFGPLLDYIISEVI